jgi:hypothetical protein
MPLKAYGAVLAALFSELDPPTRTTLGFAAILGQRMNDIDLYSLADLSIGQAMTCLMQLTHLRILRDTGAGLEFRNEIARAHAYLAVPSSLRRSLHSRIADRLLASSQHLEGVAGLDIAWHCMRAGRTAEATTQLVLGAQAAIQRGALHEAEHALSSALPHVDPKDQSRVRVQLAEVLNELDNTASAIDLLAEVLTTEATGPCFDAAFALMSLGRAQSDCHDPEYFRVDVEHLVTVIQSSDSPYVLGLAMRAIAYIAAKLRDTQLCDAILQCVPHDIDIAGSDTDRARIALSRAVLLFYSRRRPAAHALLQEYLATQRTHGGANAALCQALMGLGALELARGEFTAAQPYFAEAYSVAVRIGNERQEGVAAGNLALTADRLGDTELLHRWAEIAAGKLSANDSSYSAVLAEYCLGRAHVRRGHLAEVERCIARLRSDRFDAPQWLSQARDLYVAELCDSIHNKRGATRAGLSATTGRNSSAHTLEFVGLHAKWMARLATPETYSDVRDSLERIAREGDTLDWKDRNDVGLALQYLRRLDQVARPNSVPASATRAH